jgi:hypothetical protein
VSISAAATSKRFHTLYGLARDQLVEYDRVKCTKEKSAEIEQSKRPLKKTDVGGKSFYGSKKNIVCSCESYNPTSSIGDHIKTSQGPIQAIV